MVAADGLVSGGQLDGDDGTFEEVPSPSIRSTVDEFYKPTSMKYSRQEGARSANLRYSDGIAAARS